MSQTNEVRKIFKPQDFFVVDIKLENDICYVLDFFRFEVSRFKSLGEAQAYYSQEDIDLAKHKIRELQEEIEKQKMIIRDAEKWIRKFKRQVQAEKASKDAGRPTRSEDKKVVAKKFTSQWVISLMDVLEVKSCGKLGEMVSSTYERNWRRWLKGEAIPTYTTFEKLLRAKIEHGKYAGEELQKVPLTPQHRDLLALLRFI